MYNPGIESDGELNRRKIGDLFLYLKGVKVEGLSEILEEIKINWESGFYEELLAAFLSPEKYGISRDFTHREFTNNRLKSLAEQNLPKQVMDVGLTYVEKFKAMYPFMETVYFMAAERPLLWNDFLNIYFGGLDARLIYGLEDFDKEDFQVQPNAMFFRKLGKIRLSGKAMEINHKLSHLMEYMGKDIFGTEFEKFSTDYCPLEEAFINFVAACCAMEEDKEEIEVEDIVRAYKIFFKFIQSDLMFYEAPQYIIEKIPEYSGYLVCNGCSGYYGLLPEESPEDYMFCQCGGQLQFTKTLDKRLISP